MWSRRLKHWIFHHPGKYFSTAAAEFANPGKFYKPKTKYTPAVHTSKKFRIRHGEFFLLFTVLSWPRRRGWKLRLGGYKAKRVGERNMKSWRRWKGGGTGERKFETRNEEQFKTPAAIKGRECAAATCTTREQASEWVSERENGEVNWKAQSRQQWECAVAKEGYSGKEAGLKINQQIEKR